MTPSLPCTGAPLTTAPPNASASAWCPRQTPSTGTPARAKDSIARARSRPARAARAGRDDQPLGSAREQLVDVGGVVADDLRLAAHLPEVLDEVVGEGVVVVDDEDLHGQSCWRQASAIAAKTAPAFASVSRTS